MWEAIRDNEEPSVIQGKYMAFLELMKQEGIDRSSARKRLKRSLMRRGPINTPRKKSYKEFLRHIALEDPEKAGRFEQAQKQYRRRVLRSLR